MAFELSEIAPDLIRGRFTREVKDPHEVFDQINRLFPDGDMGEKFSDSQAVAWAARRELFLWWD
jgi:hypothetical protein